MNKDTIYRQAAIDALMVRDKELRNINWYDKPFAEGECKGIDYALEIVNALPSAQPEIIRCKDCKHWTQSMGKMKGYGLGRCDFHDADLVTCNGYCYWAERRTDETD